MKTDISSLKISSILRPMRDVLRDVLLFLVEINKPFKVHKVLCTNRTEFIVEAFYENLDCYRIFLNIGDNISLHNYDKKGFINLITINQENYFLIFKYFQNNCIDFELTETAVIVMDYILNDQYLIKCDFDHHRNAVIIKIIDENISYSIYKNYILKNGHIEYYSNVEELMRIISDEF